MADPVSLSALAVAGAEAGGTAGAVAGGSGFGLSTILGAVGLGGSAAGGLLGAFGSNYKGEAEANMFNYRAGVADLNRKIALQNADYERNAGEVSAQESGMRTRAQVGETAAAQASSGLDINRGSAAAVRTSETEIGQQNEAIIRANAARRAYGYEVEATQDQAQSQLYQMAAKTSKTSGGLSAFQSILSGGTSVADKWLKANQVGLFGDTANA
jgi:hypothetical protein